VKFRALFITATVGGTMAATGLAPQVASASALTLHYHCQPSGGSVDPYPGAGRTATFEAEYGTLDAGSVTILEPTTGGWTFQSITPKPGWTYQIPDPGRLELQFYNPTTTYTMLRFGYDAHNGPKELYENVFVCTPVTVPSTAVTISPSPTIAAEGSLAPGEQVTLTLTAYDSLGIDPNALVWIDFVSYWPDGHLAYAGHSAYGTLAVSSAALKSSGNSAVEYQANASGQLTLTYAAATAPPPTAGWSDAILANVTSGGQPQSPIDAMAYSQYVYGS
jgi:hypothetical protein